MSNEQESRPQPTAPTVIVQPADSQSRKRSLLNRLLVIALVVSILVNISLYASFAEYFGTTASPTERYHSGERSAKSKIAIINVTGTIMPPYTERILRAIQRAKEDSAVKGVLLSIDSPGGLVADSHQIYHRLRELRQDKPIYVAMKRLAASGGIYVAMGAGVEGRIYAEPTTWTGSIGVIIPRYDLTQLSDNIGLKVEPLKTGALKDSLSPFRELSQEEIEVWDRIMQDAFQRFVNVIADNRKQLDEDAVKKLATGEVFTATDALENSLVDEIGFEEDALTALRKQLGLKRARIVTYQFQPTITDFFLGTVQQNQQDSVVDKLLEASVPRAMYLCSWAPGFLSTTNVGSGGLRD